MDVFGVPISIWHSLIVEEPSGISVFIILVLAVRVITDILYRGKPPTPRVETIRQGSDLTAFWGSLAAVFFLILSAITGYLIQPYSLLVAEPSLINLALLALGALFFWSAYFVLRLFSGPKMWNHRGLYLMALVTAVLALLFDSLAASAGAELTLGQSALQPVYKALNFTWRTFTIQPLEIGTTMALVIVGLIIVVVAAIRRHGDLRATTQ